MSPSSAAGCSSPTRPASVRAVLPGWNRWSSARLERRLGLERAVERLDHALRAAEAALDDAGDADCARPAARRRRDRRARSRTARSARCRRRRCAAPPRRGSGAATCAASSARPRSARAGSRAPGSAPVRAQRRRVGLGEAEPDERVLERGGAAAARGSASRTSPAAPGSVNGTSSSRKRATSSTTSISRVTSRARQVGASTRSPSRSKPSRSSSPCWSCRQRSRSRSARRRARAGRGSPAAAGRPAWTSACADPARRR